MKIIDYINYIKISTTYFLKLKNNLLKLNPPDFRVENVYLYLKW